MSNLNLNKAKALKNDEFYTRLEDIENEMPYYTKYFKNATVYCNCDNPAFSNFWRFFHINFKKLGLKKLWATYINLDGSSSCLVEYTGGHDSDIFTGEVIPLKGNGDFRSEECVELLKQSDIVVTNPPFSLFREFIDLCIKYQAKFLVLGNMNISFCKEIFPLFQNKKVWYGVSLNSGSISFITPKKDMCSSFGCIRWFTNLKHGFTPKPLILTKKYNAKDYPKYDNYDAIEVSRIKNIPYDYNGIMGVPITFLDKWNSNQFEIVGASGCGSTNRMVCTSSKTKRPILKGRTLYLRVFIKRKK